MIVGSVIGLLSASSSALFGKLGDGSQYVLNHELALN